MNISILNIDLFSVGLAVAANLILGFVILFNDSKSVTSRFFFFFTFATAGWSIFNYLNYKVNDPVQVIWFIRTVMFFATLQAISFFLLMYVFPDKIKIIPNWIKFYIFPLGSLIGILTYSPYVFSGITSVSIGDVPEPIPSWGIIPFGIFTISLVILGIYFLIKKIMNSENIYRMSYIDLMIGVVVMFFLIVFLNFFAPIFFGTTRFIPLSAIFTLPFVVSTAYAIYKHHLLNIKVIATEVMTFILAVISFFEVVIADSSLILIFRSAILILIISFGVLLIRSVRKEVEQRERLEELNARLEIAKNELEDLSRFKTQLLSLAGHQIKSPLAAIKGFISIMLQGLYGPIDPKIKETLEKMKRASDDLIELTNSILDLRKVEEGKMDYKFEKTSLTVMVKNKVEELQPLASGKGIKLEFNSPSNEIFVQADRTKLEQVVQNLIDNAIKYTPEGCVRVELKEENTASGKGAILSVSDSGMGMSPELIPHLFNEFVRDERVKKEIKGTGFGLYIAKSIVESHGGTIKAESLGEGKGSTFSVRLREV